MAITQTFQTSPETLISVSESGSLGPGLTFVFLHFWGGSSRTWSRLITTLPPNQHTLCISLRGWGSSTGPSSPESYSIRDLASDVKDVIVRLKVHEFILVGHSMGGKVAQLIAGEKMLSGLRGLVLVAPAPPGPLNMPKEAKEQQRQAYHSRESAEFVARNILTSKTLAVDVISALVDDMLCGSPSAKEAWPTYSMLEDVSKAARDIDVPCLVVAGEKDQVETVERIRSEVLPVIKGSRLEVIDGCGHLIPVEAPEVLAGFVTQFASSVSS